MTPAIESLRRQLLQLRAQHEQELLAADAYAKAREPLERALVDQLMMQPSADALRPSRALWLGFALAVCGLGLAGYSFTGSPTRGVPVQSVVRASPVEKLPPAVMEEDKPSADDPRVTEIVDRMTQALKQTPDNPRGWALLARAHAAMGQPGLAVPAFQKALALSGDDADLMADYANALAGQENGRFGPEATSLIERALAREPGNLKAMALAGSIAFDGRDYVGAVRLWGEVAQRLPADSAMLSQVQASLARARELGGLPAARPRTRPGDGNPPAR